MKDMGICICIGSTKKYKHGSDCFNVGVPYYYKTNTVESIRNGEIISRTKYNVYVDLDPQGYPITFSPDQFDEFFKPV